jgi:hypothetical protein
MKTIYGLFSILFFLFACGSPESVEQSTEVIEQVEQKDQLKQELEWEKQTNVFEKELIYALSGEVVLVEEDSESITFYVAYDQSYQATIKNIIDIQLSLENAEELIDWRPIGEGSTIAINVGIKENHYVIGFNREEKVMIVRRNH